MKVVGIWLTKFYDTNALLALKETAFEDFFACSHKTLEEIENINLDELGKLDPIVLQENIKNRMDYRNSLIMLFLYKRFILM